MPLLVAVTMPTGAEGAGATPEVVRERTLEILRQRTGDPAYIFNLGHGVLPETPVECVRTLVETVKSFEP